MRTKMTADGATVARTAAGTLRTLSNDVVIGLMRLALERA